MFSYLRKSLTTSARPIDFNDAEERGLALKHLTSSALPIVKFAMDGDKAPRPVGIGTGAMFEIGERVLLLSAAHVLRKDEVDDALSPCGFAIPIDGGSVPIGGTLRARPELDVAVLELEPQEVSALRSRYTLLTLENVMGFDEGQWFADEFLLSGYPWDRQEFEGSSGTLDAFTLRSVAYRGADPQSLTFIDWRDRPFLPDVDFLLHHGKTGLLPNGEAVPMPRLQGMSGCSLWSTLVGGTVPGALRVVGLQCATFQARSDEKIAWVRCTLWHAIARFLASEFADLRPVIAARFGMPS